MSAAKNTYTIEIAAVVLRLADQLNTDYKCLPDDFTGEFKAFFLDICSEFHSSHDYKAAAPRTRRTMHRIAFQKIIYALKQFPDSTESSVLIDGLYHLRHFSTRPDVPSSPFYDDKAVIAHDALIYILHAICFCDAPSVQRRRRCGMCLCPRAYSLALPVPRAASHDQ
ncbi:hypothetical protein CPB85DRAFT_1325722 [Mucidula mucida]|nr:hypothetical protein CPB85DRAFT_1325722 [Mucidula mucida]